jgi:hypothetical protein
MTTLRDIQAVLQCRLGPVSAEERDDVEAEATRLMEFLAPDADASELQRGVLADRA